MTGAEWTALVIQAIAAISAAAAAIFAWLATRNVKESQESERRLRATEQLKTIHRLIGLYYEQFHDSQPGMLTTRLQLRSELVVTPILLPKCLELADPQPPFDLSKINAQVDAALAEVEDAQRAIWSDQEVARIRSERGTED